MVEAAVTTVKYVALHLPQFHAIPENDEWWGKGFTEWRNVLKGRPRFRGHYQPHLPGALGFYDLTSPAARAAQAELAGRYGVDAFCYYHYWFRGRRLLERPVDEIVATGEPDFPFCLCWANESWSRRWDGRDEQVLMRQDYSEEDHHAHFGWLLSRFRDRRYLRIDERPLFLVYRAHDIPDVGAVTSLWRRLAHDAGLPGLYLVSVRNGWNATFDPVRAGFDASMKFQPFWPHVDELWRRKTSSRLWQLGQRLRSGRRDRVVSYSDFVEEALAAAPPPFPEFPSVTPMWDNSVRRDENAVILHSSSPRQFQHWLAEATRRVVATSLPPVVFINAWNEWAEGNHLEPDQRHGLAYLKSVELAKRG